MPDCCRVILRNGNLNRSIRQRKYLEYIVFKTDQVFFYEPVAGSKILREVKPQKVADGIIGVKGESITVCYQNKKKI
jgi:hypothetical protein